MAVIRFLLLCIISLSAIANTPLNLWETPNSSSFSSATNEFLPVEEVFHAYPSIENNNLMIRWTALPKHYLYKSRFKFNLDALKTSTPIFPEGLVKQDDYFGEVEVYYDETNIQIPLPGGATTIPSGSRIELTSQGCADAGLCYPPYSLWFQWKNNSWNPISANAPLTSPTSQEQALSVDKRAETANTNNDYWTGLLNAENLAWTLLLFFLAGLGLTFTPCVLPMVPILSSIIVGQKDPSKAKAFILSLIYVLAMATTYAIAGAVTGYFGAEFNLQAKLQSPYILIPFSILFVALAMSMFGYYELQLPSGLQSKLAGTSQKQTSGSLWGVAVMGVLSALVVSPCVSAPLIGALVFISSSGDALLGASALLSLGLGMGLPLIFIGVFGAQLLPKAGAWMESIKAFFGILLLAVALWFIERLIPGPLALALWSALAIGSALFLGALNSTASGAPAFIARTLGILLLIYGAALFVGALQGNKDPLNPLSHISTNTEKARSYVNFNIVTTTDALETALANAAMNQQPVLLDVYADWCISCKVVEREVFQSPNVAPQLNKFQLIKFDITDITPEQQKWLSEHQLFGPPVYLFYDNKGNEISDSRLVGEFDEIQFLNHIASF